LSGQNLDLQKGIILDEQSRTYFFPKDEKVTLNKVFEVKVSPSGTHRINTRTEVGLVKLHIIPTGWLHIEIDTPKQDWTF
jgi:hypothetical protein